jgi:DNA-directed RNA polymerase subunit N (RpoN/RPB10)
MLFYIRCPSCSRVISENMDKYYDEILALADDPNKTQKQKDAEGAKLLEKYGYTKICCRIRIMGLIPYHLIIQT